LHKSSKATKREMHVLDTFTKFLKNDEYLMQINNIMIENYRDFRISADMSPATISIEIRVLKAAFNKAIEWVMIKNNPVNGIKLPKSDIVKIRFLKMEEINRLLKVIKDDNNVEFLELILAYLHTGARRIEILNPLFA